MLCDGVCGQDLQQGVAWYVSLFIQISRGMRATARIGDTGTCGKVTHLVGLTELDIEADN